MIVVVPNPRPAGTGFGVATRLAAALGLDEVFPEVGVGLEEVQPLKSNMVRRELLTSADPILGPLRLMPSGPWLQPVMVTMSKKQPSIAPHTKSRFGSLRGNCRMMRAAVTK